MACLNTRTYANLSHVMCESQVAIRHPLHNKATENLERIRTERRDPIRSRKRSAKITSEFALDNAQKTKTNENEMLLMVDNKVTTRAETTVKLGCTVIVRRNVHVHASCGCNSGTKSEKLYCLQSKNFGYRKSKNEHDLSVRPDIFIVEFVLLSY